MWQEMPWTTDDWLLSCLPSNRQPLPKNAHCKADSFQAHYASVRCNFPHDVLSPQRTRREKMFLKGDINWFMRRAISASYVTVLRKQPARTHRLCYYDAPHGYWAAFCFGSTDVKCSCIAAVQSIRSAVEPEYECRWWTRIAQETSINRRSTDATDDLDRYCAEFLSMAVCIYWIFM